MHCFVCCACVVLATCTVLYVVVLSGVDCCCLSCFCVVLLCGVSLVVDGLFVVFRVCVCVLLCRLCVLLCDWFVPLFCFG